MVCVSEVGSIRTESLGAPSGSEDGASPDSVASSVVVVVVDVVEDVVELELLEPQPLPLLLEEGAEFTLGP